jgi:hypothetical protein
MKDSGSFAITLGCHHSPETARLFRQRGLYLARNLAHVGTAGHLRLQHGDDLAHGLRTFGAGVDNRLRDQGIDFFLRQRLWQISLDDAGFILLDVGQIMASGGLELADGVFALFQHFFQNR